MKTKVLIVAFLIVSLICAFAFTGRSQAYKDNKPVVSSLGDTLNNKWLIADETWLTQLKTGAKIVTYSESVFRDISLTFGSEFKRISIMYKKDRNGPYKEYSIYLTQEVANNIKEWAKTNL